uniref:Uncharacterized protein n=1 Tax=Oryza nivara TaxID=4536 RepID=A0A0E0I3K0_ORYNI
MDGSRGVCKSPNREKRCQYSRRFGGIPTIAQQSELCFNGLFAKDYLLPRNIILETIKPSAYVLCKWMLISVSQNDSEKQLGYVPRDQLIETLIFR